jgi:hypothetical protein
MQRNVNLKRMTLKELKLLAGQKLGELAAKLKTKADLISALEQLIPEPKGPVRPKLVPVVAAEVKPAPAPQPKYGAPKAPVASPPAVKPQVVPKKPTKAVAPRPVAAVMPKVTLPVTETVAARPPAPVMMPAAPSLTVTQDFFVQPGTARLPASHADDRVLAFPRDTGGLYVSWDFSERTWGAGSATLEVVEGDEVLSSQPIDAPWGGRFIEVAASSAVFVEIRRGPALLGRSHFLSLPPSRGAKTERKRLKVRWSEPLPTRAQAMASNRPYRGLTGVRTERVDVSSGVRLIEEDELPAGFHSSSW